MALTFTVRRRDPELVGPASPTPRETTKRLSTIDGPQGFRVQAPFMFFYRFPPRADARPAGVIRTALAGALVPYYPLAGRLREVEARKLVVDCTGEGVLFVEADADVRLAELEAAGLTPPFPCMDQLLFDVEGEGSGGLFNCTLLLIQVTRLLCGGFVLALRLNHTICDGIGLAQFLSAVAELARGLPAPTVSPAWSRDLLEARTPPPVVPHHEPEAAPSPLPPPPPPGGDMVQRTFTFAKAAVGTIRSGLPPGLRDTATTFEVLASALWRARTAALELPPDEDALLVFIANVRGVPGLGLPAGYYGDACVPVPVRATVEAVAAGSLGDALRRVREAKATVTASYVRCVAAGILRRRPRGAMANVFVVSDNRRLGFRHVDFGWGVPVYGGPATATFGTSYLVAVGDGDGEDAAALLIVLPLPAMDRFASEVERLLKP